MASRDRRGPRGKKDAAIYETGSGSDPFGILAAEHAILRQRFARVSAAADDAPRSGSVPRSLDALSESLRLHQRREDSVLYPLCESLFGGKLGAAAVLRDDHAAIFEQLVALVQESRATGRISKLRLDTLWRDLDDHFGKEERILFPLTAALLSGTESSALARRLRDASSEEARP